MTGSYAVVGIIMPPWLAAVLIVLIGLRAPKRARGLAVAALAISTAASVEALRLTWGGQTLWYRFGGWEAPIGIVFQLDVLSAVLALLVSVISAAVFVYAGPSVEAELPGHESTFLATACLLVAALFGIVLTGDLFNLYVFVEISSITVYALVASGGGAASLAAFRYLLIGTVGASFYLLGLAYIFSLTGTLNMADMAQRLPAVEASAPVLVAAAFIVTGFGMKMALFPMHGWLPDAYTYAPSAATALIAGLSTKVAAFALLRVLYGVLWPSLGALGPPIAATVGWLAAAAILAGSIMALAQTDVKRLLAYSSISHLGYVALGVALGNPNALTGATLHIIAHAMMKCGLFLVVGAAAFRFGATTMTEMRGLGARMPIIMGSFLVMVLSMIGLPPTVGFFSKWYLIIGALDAQQPVFMVVLLVSSLLNAWYFFRLIEIIYFSAPDGSEAGRVELPRSMVAPIVGIACALLIVGLLSFPLARQAKSGAIGALSPYQPTVRVLHE